MIQNKLFRECLAEIPEDRMAEFELSFAIAERIVDVLKQHLQWRSGKVDRRLLRQGRARTAAQRRCHQATPRSGKPAPRPANIAASASEQRTLRAPHGTQ